MHRVTRIMHHHNNIRKVPTSLLFALYLYDMSGDNNTQIRYEKSISMILVYWVIELIYRVSFLHLLPTCGSP